MAGNTKAWLMTNSRKEISFTDHTHSQYVTEVDINSMIEDVIDSYVPKIQTMGQVGIIEAAANQTTTITTIPSSATVFLFGCREPSYDYGAFMSIKYNSTWSSIFYTALSSHIVFHIRESRNEFRIDNELNKVITLRYVYF